LGVGGGGVGGGGWGGRGGGGGGEGGDEGCRSGMMSRKRLIGAALDAASIR